MQLRARCLHGNVGSKCVGVINVEPQLLQCPGVVVVLASATLRLSRWLIFPDLSPYFVSQR
jgi:hypothetical protein